MRQPSKTNLAGRTGFAGRTGLAARPNRSGYTLLELVIVLAILAAITAIAWPRILPLLSRSSHQAAALQLKADLVEAREQAVHNGEVWELRAVLGTNRYVIGPARRAHDIDQSEQDTILYQKLPDDIVFSRQRSSQKGLDSRNIGEDSSHLTRSDERDDIGNGNQDDNRIDEARETIHEESRSLTNSATEETRIAIFFPDGRVTETVIELVRPATREKIAVQLRGLTGGITIGSLESMTAPSESLVEDLPLSEEPNP